MEITAWKGKNFWFNLLIISTYVLTFVGFFISRLYPEYMGYFVLLIVFYILFFIILQLSVFYQLALKYAGKKVSGGWLSEGEGLGEYIDLRIKKIEPSSDISKEEQEAAKRFTRKMAEEMGEIYVEIEESVEIETVQQNNTKKEEVAPNENTV